MRALRVQLVTVVVPGGERVMTAFEALREVLVRSFVQPRMGRAA